LIGKSADPEVQELIKMQIQSDPQIEKVFNVLTIQIGPYIMLAGKIKLKSGISIETACEIINVLEKNLKKNIPEIKWSFIEPDLEDWSLTSIISSIMLIIETNLKLIFLTRIIKPLTNLRRGLCGEKEVVWGVYYSKMTTYI